MKTHQRPRKFRRVSAAILIAVGASATGCQVDVGGQTLPSPYYLSDDVQYFAPGPEFKLAREAAAMKLNRAQAEALDLLPPRAPAAQPGQ